jgi:amino acid efflux transporter
VATAFGVIAVLYVGLAVATISVTGSSGSKVPLADLLGAGLGDPGRKATAVLAVVLTMGTMNVYVAGGTNLARALLPRVRPLLSLAVLGSGVLALLVVGVLQADQVVRATSACFIAIYVLALAAAVRILAGRLRVAAAVALAMSAVLAVFSSYFLLLPAATAAITLALRRRRGMLRG